MGYGGTEKINATTICRLLIAASLRLIAPDSVVARGAYIASLQGRRVHERSPDRHSSPKCAGDEKLQGETCSGAARFECFACMRSICAASCATHVQGFWCARRPQRVSAPPPNLANPRVMAWVHGQGSSCHRIRSQRWRSQSILRALCRCASV